MAPALLLSIALPALTLQRQPALTKSAAPADLSHSTGLIRKRLRAQPVADQEKQFVLTADDLQVAAGLVLSRKRLEGVTHVHIDGQQLIMQGSIQLSGHLSGLFLNVDLVAENGARQAILKRLRIGNLTFSAPFAWWVVKGIINSPPLTRYGQLLEKMLKEVHITEERVTLILRWNRALLSELGGLLTEVADRQRMIVYHEKLVRLLNTDTHSRFIRLGQLMQPLFVLAHERSLSNQEPVEENRAAVLVLSAYTNGKDLNAALGTSEEPPRRGVLLNRRVDTARHFMGAAAMAMSGQGTLVEMIGLAKELHDTHDGSGFSFIDIAADEAGALLGKYAVRSSDMAFRIQEKLSLGVNESQFIPPMDDLPESMDSEEFVDRFKAIGSPEYETLKKEINARIMALPLFQLPKTAAAIKRLE